MLAVSLTGTVVFAGAPRPLALGSNGPSASLNSDGTLARSKGIVSASRIKTGQYVVKTTQVITDCVFIATLGSPGDILPGSGEVQTALRTGTQDSVFILTTNSGGSATDRNVMLDVVCM
jgi:hypothetical protein